jgi:hypothetical protein
LLNCKKKVVSRICITEVNKDFFYIVDAIKKYSEMKRILQFLKIVRFFIFLPHEVSEGSKKEGTLELKK